MVPDEGKKGVCMKNDIIINDTEQPLPEAPFADLIGLMSEKGYVKLTIIWRKDIPRKEQVMKLRKLCPELRKYSMGEIYTRIQEKEVEWEFAIMGYANGTDIAKRAQDEGLKVEVIKL